MTTRGLLGVTTIAVSALLVTLPASGACIPNKTASTFGSGTTAYWMPATTVGTAALQVWQLGSPGTFLSTGCPSTALFQDGTGFSLNFQLGSCGIGCPGPNGDNTLAVLAQNKTATGGEFLLATAVETPASINNYDFGPQGDHTMIPIPRPRPVSSSRDGTCINVVFAFDSIVAGLFGPNAGTAVTGFRLLIADSNSDPGSDPAAYALLATVDSPGGAAATTTACVPDTRTDHYLATQLVFENGTVISDTISQRTRVLCVRCQLADPKPKGGPARVGPRGSSPD